MSNGYEIIWQLGEPWQDFTAELSSGVHTVVTASLALHVIDMDAGFHLRSTGVHWMLFDDTPRRLDEIAYASSCGMHMIGGEPGAWHATTPLILVVRGEVRDFTTLRARPAIEQAARTRGWDLTGHPTQRCQALHCLLKGPRE